MVIIDPDVGHLDKAASRARVLVIEDSPEYRVMVSTVLSNAGYEVAEASDGRSGLDLAVTFDPAVILLDLGLPDLDGLTVCEELRRFTDAYIMMLTGRDGEDSRYDGLTVGADDYLTKPFAAKELVLRVEVLLRRPRVGAPSKPPDLEFGDIRVDRTARRVWVADREVNLTKIELAMLDALMAQPDVALERRTLAMAIWGPHWVGEDHVINVHLANLRKKIDADTGGRIVTVRGVGYRFEPHSSS